MLDPVALIANLHIGADQLFIGLFGATAIRLSQDRRSAVRRWACILGLLGQPFWFYTTAAHGQWGIFLLSFYYAWSWGRGFVNFWVNKTEA